MSNVASSDLGYITLAFIIVPFLSLGDYTPRRFGFAGTTDQRPLRCHPDICPRIGDNWAWASSAFCSSSLSSCSFLLSSSIALAGCGKTFPGAPKGQIRCPAEPGINNLHG